VTASPKLDPRRKDGPRGKRPPSRAQLREELRREIEELTNLRDRTIKVG
jgi:hypothetical protein